MIEEIIKIKNIAKKLIRVGERISQEKGLLNFFGIFERTDIENKWDIIISAPWFSAEKERDLIYVIKNIQKDLSKEDLIFFARVVLMKPEDKLIQALNNNFNISFGKNLEIENRQINGIRLKHAYIITSKKSK